MLFEKISCRFSASAAALTLSFFIVANLCSYARLDYDFVSKTDAATNCGFPFTFYYFSGWGAGLIWTGIIANYLVAIAVSIFAGVVWKAVCKSNQNS